MLATDKIQRAFAAICEEVDKLEKKNIDEETWKCLQTIRSIAKHQSDVRDAPKGSCTAKH